MIITEAVHKSNLLYDKDQRSYPEDYFFYCLELIRTKLKNTDKQANIIIGDIPQPEINNLKNIRVAIQVEHTLVLEEANIGKVSSSTKGTIKTSKGNFYWVNIFEDYLNQYDIIIDYSIPNILNIKSCERYNEISKKLINISPVIYDYNAEKNTKSQTLVFHNGSERRNKLLINAKNFEYFQKFAYSKQDILNLFDSSRIILNIHQTDFHHTLEEFRVLPALLRGVIVVSECVPLAEKIPYSEYIIWAEYENLIETVKKVQQNYGYYFDKIFGSESLKNIIEETKQKNLTNLDFLVSLM